MVSHLSVIITLQYGDFSAFCQIIEGIGVITHKSLKISLLIQHLVRISVTILTSAIFFNRSFEEMTSIACLMLCCQILVYWCGQAFLYLFYHISLCCSDRRHIMADLNSEYVSDPEFFVNLMYKRCKNYRRLINNEKDRQRRLEKGEIINPEELTDCCTRLVVCPDWCSEGKADLLIYLFVAIACAATLLFLLNHFNFTIDY